MIPYGRQDIQDQDINAVIEVLRSDYLTQGPAVPKFENAVAKLVGAEYAVAANSATSALHMACLALGLGPGDTLWTSPISFVASANVGIYCGANVDFVDIDPDTFNMCPARLRSKLNKAEALGTLPKVIIPVHMCGQSCDMSEIFQVAREFDVKIIEDASHAIGGIYEGNPVGSCHHSDITVFSFHPVKIITSAEGGMATTNDSTIAERLTLARSHGITRDPALMVRSSDGPWDYQQISLGWNYRMTDIQAALGLSQLTRLSHYVAVRNSIADHYDISFRDLDLAIPERKKNRVSACHLYIIRLNDPSRRLPVFEYLRAAGIGVNVHYIPIHLQPFYSDRGFARGDYPKAEAYYSRCISLPMFPSASESQLEKVISTVSRAIKR